MSEEGPAATAIDNFDSVKGEGGSNVTSIRLVGFDKPFFTAFAIVLSLAAAMFCFFTYMQEQRRVYFTQRCEAFIEQATLNHKPVPYTICGPREE